MLGSLVLGARIQTELAPLEVQSTQSVRRLGMDGIENCKYPRPLLPRVFSPVVERHVDRWDVPLFTPVSIFEELRVSV